MARSSNGFNQLGAGAGRQKSGGQRSVGICGRLASGSVGWPELEFISSSAPEMLVEHLRSTGVFRAALIDVPKENWGVRPAVVLNILDRLTYQALVDRLSVDLIGDLSPSVYGWRLPPDSTERGEYSHNNIQWDAYRDHLSVATTFSRAGYERISSLASRACR